mmetsp:Transcript_47279/g.117051  ORF Transcript_47279/g.117051 Transcript_47279/m.117051 type:complete len:82 (+) Transcript_47279:1153-1398(+)
MTCEDAHLTFSPVGSSAAALHTDAIINQPMASHFSGCVRLRSASSGILSYRSKSKKLCYFSIAPRGRQSIVDCAIFTCVSS